MLKMRGRCIINEKTRVETVFGGWMLLASCSGGGLDKTTGEAIAKKFQVADYVVLVRVKSVERGPAQQESPIFHHGGSHHNI